MQHKFPKDFIWGTSTASSQIETASNHAWKGLKAQDGYTFLRTTDHEKRREEDAGYISKLGNAYRLSLDWSRLQTAPNAPFEKTVIKEYRDFLSLLKEKGTYIMLVAHHFTNPLWFDNAGHWWGKDAVKYFSNYVEQLVEHFGDLVNNWNTFNEPGVYLTNGFLTGNFPPHKKMAIRLMVKSMNNMAAANVAAVKIIKKSYPKIPIGISKNTVNFYGRNLLGKAPAALMNWFFNRYVAERFIDPLDYFGISYYARIGFDPSPITFIDTPEKIKQLGLPHDGMWEYYPEAMGDFIRYFWKKYKKPFIITESGVCTEDSNFRIQSIKHYLGQLHDLINKEDIDIKGYFHWSLMDNFEWNIGPTFRFGLVHVDFENETYNRTMKPCGEFYQKVVKGNGF